MHDRQRNNKNASSSHEHRTLNLAANVPLIIISVPCHVSCALDDRSNKMECLCEVENRICDNAMRVSAVSSREQHHDRRFGIGCVLEHHFVPLDHGIRCDIEASKRIAFQDICPCIVDDQIRLKTLSSSIQGCLELVQVLNVAHSRTQLYGDIDGRFRNEVSWKNT